MRTNPIINSWRNGDVDEASSLIEDYFCNPKDVNEAIRWSCRVGDRYLFKILLEKSDQKDDKSRSIVLSCQSGHLDMFKYIKRINFSVDESTLYRCLSVASENGHVGIVREILKYDLDYSQLKFLTKAHTKAAKNGHLETIFGYKNILNEKQKQDLCDTLCLYGHMDVLREVVKSFNYSYEIQSHKISGILRRLAQRGAKEIFDVMNLYEFKNKTQKQQILQSTVDTIITHKHMDILIGVLRIIPDSNKINTRDYSEVKMEFLRDALIGMEREILEEQIGQSVCMEEKISNLKRKM